MGCSFVNSCCKKKKNKKVNWRVANANRVDGAYIVGSRLLTQAS